MGGGEGFSEDFYTKISAEERGKPSWRSAHLLATSFLLDDLVWRNQDSLLTEHWQQFYGS